MKSILFPYFLGDLGTQPRFSVSEWTPVDRGEYLSQAVQTTVSGYRISGSSSLPDGYDEPEILLSAIRPVCLKGSDAGHNRNITARAPWIICLRR
jgi:hypothetical protein